MVKLVIIYMFSCLTFLVSEARQVGMPDSVSAKMDEYLTAAAGIYKFSGSVLVAEKGNILLNKGYGFKNAANKTFNDSKGIFQVGSVGKTFTAAIIMKLQEEGKLSLQDNLSKYFPDYPNGEAITIYHLLTHTSGIYDYTNALDPSDSAITTNPVPKEKVVEMFRNKRPAFKPGTKYSYCSSGYFLLGLIIEQITGKPFEQVMHETIFNRLNMTHSGFDFRHLNSDDKVTGYSIFNKGKQVPDIVWDSTVGYAAGGLYATTADLYKWLCAMNNNTIINASSRQTAFTPFRSNYGCGWFIDSVYGKKYVHHEGGQPGFTCQITLFPEDDVMIIVLNNFYTETHVRPVNAALTAIMFNKPYRFLKDFKAIDLEASELKQYVGVYRFDSANKAVVSFQRGHLNMAIGGGEAELFAEKDNMFFFKELNLEIEFVKDVDGKVNKLIIHEDVKDEVALKVK